MKELHPTILIGYGEYGRRCLQTLLANAAARGVLPWEEAKGVALLAERRLESLALFYVPDLLRPDAASDSAFDGLDSFEMMEDLYKQIEIIDTKIEAPAAALAAAVEAAKERLFAEHRLTRSGRMNVGLDVIVLARVSDAGTVGKLSELSGPVMERLSADPGFQAMEGQELLNFIQILDSEDFWDPSLRQSAMREAVFQELERGRDAARHRRPSFGRVYLFDGRTERGNHNETVRRGEAVLFLEFLLFEGHRSDSGLRLFYMREPHSAALCTVGIRAIEFSSARLRRLAAASFARGWLSYLAGLGAETETPPSSPLHQTVSPFLPPLLDENTIGQKHLSARVKEGLGDIEARLLNLETTAETWPFDVEATAMELTGAWKDRLAATGAGLAREAIRRHITPLPGKLNVAVTDSLSDDSFPRTAGSVIAEIETLSARLEAAASATGPADTPAEPSVPTTAFTTVHANFQEFRNRQLEPVRLRTWWPLFAVAAAVAFYPLWRDLFQEVLGDDWTSAGWQTATYLVTLSALLWAAGDRVFHPWIERAVSRPLLFFTHRERGRFAALIRSKVGSVDVKGSLGSMAQQIVTVQRQRLAGEICGQLAQVGRPLTERQREMRWLSSQLEGYLKLNGVDEKAESPKYYPNREVPAVLLTLETDGDLMRVAAANPRTESQYRHVQRKLKVLDDWHHRFSNTFLDPHRFLDRVAATFPELFDENRLATGIKGGLQHFEAFPASFHWLQTSTLPAQMSYHSIPLAWSRLDGVTSSLVHGGFHERGYTRPSGDRLFLVQGRFGIPHELIARRQETR